LNETLNANIKKLTEAITGGISEWRFEEKIKY
jgi:hypothetical protein